MQWKGCTEAALRAHYAVSLPLGSKCRVFLFDPYPMLGMMTPHPLNFRRTRESIPFGRLHEGCSDNPMIKTGTADTCTPSITQGFQCLALSTPVRYCPKSAVRQLIGWEMMLGIEYGKDNMVCNTTLTILLATV